MEGTFDADALIGFMFMREGSIGQVFAEGALFGEVFMREGSMGQTSVEGPFVGVPASLIGAVVC